MSEQEYREERSRVLKRIDAIPYWKERVPVIGRIAQLTVTTAIPLTRAWFGSRRTVLPGGRIVSIPPMHNLYVYRQDGQAGMILTRTDPFQYEHLSLSELEMQVIMGWAGKMNADDIGRFSPSDGGWFWWRK